MSTRIHGWNRTRSLLKLSSLPLGLAVVASLSGCVTPAAENQKMKAAREEPIPPVAEAPNEEESKTQEQKTLAAVEEFLARTQEYRVVPKLEVAKSQTKPAPASAESVQVSKSSQAPPPPTNQAALKDAAYANSQISIADSTVPATPQAIPAIESVTIRGPASKPVTSSIQESSRLTNNPLELASAPRNDAAETLVNSLKNEFGAKNDSETEWQLRALLLALGRVDEAGAVSEKGPPDLKGILPAWVTASAEIRNLLRGREHDVDVALGRVDELRSLLASRSQPRVKNVAMCRKVITYGSYEEMAAEDFVSGRSIQTIVYAEIENLRTISDSGGIFETKLSTCLELMTTDGKSMWQREEPEVVDRCRHPRRDFFVAQRVTFPPTLPVGDYVLKFRVEDQTSGLISEASASFSVRSPISVAKGQ